MNTREDGLANISGALSIDDVMSYNLLTTLLILAQFKIYNNAETLKVYNSISPTLNAKCWRLNTKRHYFKFPILQKTFGGNHLAVFCDNI